MIKEIPSSYILSGQSDLRQYFADRRVPYSHHRRHDLDFGLYHGADPGIGGLMSQVKSGRMTVDISSNRKDEIGTLHRRFGDDGYDQQPHPAGIQAEAGEPDQPAPGARLR